MGIQREDRMNEKGRDKKATAGVRMDEGRVGRENFLRMDEENGLGRKNGLGKFKV